MTKDKLSWGEENYLRKLCVIPTLIAFWMILVYFIHLMRIDALKNVWDFFIHVGLLFAIVPSIVFFLSFEVLYSRKVKMPFRFYLKRFLGNIFLLLTVVSLSFGVTIMTYNILSPFIEYRAIILGFLISLGLLILIVRLSGVLNNFFRGKQG